MKFSEELKLRGVEVGDTYTYTRNGDASPYTYGVCDSEFLESLLLGLCDKDRKFLRLVDKDGNKKEITKEAIEGDGMGCIIGVCNALAFTGVVVVVVCLLLGLLGN